MAEYPGSTGLHRREDLVLDPPATAGFLGKQPGWRAAVHIWADLEEGFVCNGD
ncbi:MAG TPA: hypothetical protein GX391_09845 [Firmicutes bacterium]|nr:hypothetical protein [Bacillota bacterium]HOQ24783.1 hypothetical protein [Bacillota bacterium]HPT68015.1 hypothetical protein [Bacillota bacterium]